MRICNSTQSLIEVFSPSVFLRKVKSVQRAYDLYCEIYAVLKIHTDYTSHSLLEQALMCL